MHPSGMQEHQTTDKSKCFRFNSTVIQLIQLFVNSGACAKETRGDQCPYYRILSTETQLEVFQLQGFAMCMVPTIPAQKKNDFCITFFIFLLCPLLQLTSLLTSSKFCIPWHSCLHRLSMIQSVGNLDRLKFPSPLAEPIPM